MYRYLCLLIIPLTVVTVPTPCQVMHPQIITLTFGWTGGDTHSEDSASSLTTSTPVQSLFSINFPHSHFLLYNTSVMPLSIWHRCAVRSDTCLGLGWLYILVKSPKGTLRFVRTSLTKDFSSLVKNPWSPASRFVFCAAPFLKSYYNIGNWSTTNVECIGNMQLFTSLIPHRYNYIFHVGVQFFSFFLPSLTLSTIYYR